MKPTSSREPEPGESIKDFGITVIATEGSRWELWETEHRYRRSPLTETSRENPAWGGPEAGPLQDHVWHEFTHWEITAYPFGARLVIDLTDAHFWDITGVGTLDKTVIRFRREGTAVEVVGLNEASAAMVERFAVHDKPDAEKLLAAH